jgi:hypothetical protein
MVHTHTPSTAIGEYTRIDAFAAARSLEHAGITADVRGHGDTYRVLVTEEDADRARRLV